MNKRAMLRAIGTGAVGMMGLACLPAVAATEAEFKDAHEQFQKANGGDTEAVDAAVSKFSALVKADPTNPLLTVYLGAATSMQARNTRMPWRKISFAEDGMALEDKALALLTPAHDKEVSHGTAVTLLVKFTAANTFLAVPGFFNRGEQGSKLLKEVLSSPLFDASSASFKGGVWLRAGKTAADKKNVGEARTFLEMVIKANAPQAEAARKLLAVL